MEQWSNAEQVGENLFKTKEGQAITAPKQTCDLTQSISIQSVSCAPCYNQSIKRLTTMASKSSPHSGSFINGVHWYNSYIGTSSTNNSPWTTSSQTAGYCNVPSSQVTASFINPGEETVNIRVP